MPAMRMPDGSVAEVTEDELHSWVHEIMPQYGFVGVHRDTMEQVERDMAVMLDAEPDEMRAYLERLHGDIQRLLDANAPTKLLT